MKKRIVVLLICLIQVCFEIYAESAIKVPKFYGVKIGDSKSTISSILRNNDFYTEDYSTYMNMNRPSNENSFEGFYISAISVEFYGDISYVIGLGFDENVKIVDLKKAMYSYLDRNYKTRKQVPSNNPRSEAWIVDDKYLFGIMGDGSKSFIQIYDMDYIEIN